MSFLHPEYFYYLLPPLFIVFAILFFKKQEEEHFFTQDVMDKLRVSTHALTLKKRNLLFFFILLLMITALAEPIIKEGSVEVKSKSADIMIALDISDSMLAQDVYPNRLKFAKQKALTLLKEAPEERIGVIAFAKNSYLVSPMSFDHSAVGFLLKQLSTESITEKGTDFISLLDVVDRSIKEDSKKYLLIFTDGGDKEDFSKEIEYAKERGIVVFILGIGTQKGAPIKQKNGEFIKYKGEIIVSKLNEDVSELATSTGGVYIEAIKSDKDVKTMLQEIDAISEQKELKSETIKKFIPLFYYPVALALFLLLIATSSWRSRGVAHLFVVLVLSSSVAPKAEAGLLDFVELQKAKEAYEMEDYEKAARIYSKYAEDNNDAHSYFNAGNSFYQEGKYKEAVSLYEKSIFKKKEYKANRFANLGNAHAKLAGQENLLKAKKYFEESLKLVDDKKIRENLEEVKKKIKEEKKKANNQQDKNQDKQEQNKENNQENQDQENQDKPQDDKQDKDSQEEEKDSKDDKSQNDSQDQKQNESEQNKDQEDKDKSEEENANNEEQKQEDKEQQKQELDKLGEEKQEQQKASQVSAAEAKDEMSDDEQRKWLQQLNANQNSYMYLLNDNQNKEEDSDERPW